MNHGFYISKLEIRGVNLATASLTFKKGFNLVSGGSDTGKSYAFSCLEFMMGKIDSPKNIPESSGYTDAYLEINTYTNDTYTLVRKLNDGSNFRVKDCNLSEFDSSKKNIETFGVYPNSSKNISDFFLMLCGIETTVQIKSKNDNTSRKFTFTILRNLTFVNETNITVESSPIYANQSYTDHTYYKNALSFILNGKNANDLVSVPDNQQMKSWTNGKINLVKSQIIHFTSVLEKLRIERLEYSTPNLDATEKLKIKLENLHGTLNKYISDKTKLLEDIESNKSQLIYKKELLLRLELLKEHYLSDKKRLEFILEGEQLLGQLNTVDCPICEGVLNQEKVNYIQNNEGVKTSIEFENEKIQIKISDLNKTIEDNSKEIETFEFDIVYLTLQYERIEAMITKELNPSLDNLRAEISNSKTVNRLDAKIDVYTNELEYYSKEEIGLLSELNKVEKTNDAGTDGFGISNLMSFIKDILKIWNYENNIEINFNSKHRVYDFEILGKPRGSYGKGMRSISYTAFILSILKYCLVNSRPFSNLLVFDSPLTAFHKGMKDKVESKDEISKGIQESFFRDLVNTEENCQIIVFDNKFPEDDRIKSKLNFEYFTKDPNYGRYGLFPLK